MITIKNASLLFISAREQQMKGHFSEAIGLLEDAHKNARDKPLMHTRIHILWFIILLEMKKPKEAFGQIVPALFAFPVSLIIKVFSRRKNGDLHGM